MEVTATAELKEKCFEGRKAIEECKDRIDALRKSCGENQTFPDEAVPNILLAYRHLEDARMRLGKAIQALDGGTSCYPR